MTPSPPRARPTEAIETPEFVTELECDHCGDVAFESPSGLFTDGDGPACLTCGLPGHVSVSGDEEDGDVWWFSSDDEEDRCTRPDCEECRAIAQAEGT